LANREGDSTFDSPELLREEWIKAFASLLQAELSGVEDQKVEELWSRYMRLSLPAGPDLLHGFMSEAVRRVEKTFPDFTERLLLDLRARGLLREMTLPQGEA
jgi:hypothetical protein